jgi:hypothetical protein
MTKKTKLIMHNITDKSALKSGYEHWMLKQRDEQRLEASQLKFLRPLLRITKLDKKRNQSVRDTVGVQNTVREIQEYQQKWLQHLQRMK